MNNLQRRKETQFRNVATPVYILTNLPSSDCVEANRFDGIQVLYRYPLREHPDLSRTLEHECVEGKYQKRGFGVSLTTCQKQTM
jgi:hypothetical protein